MFTSQVGTSRSTIRSLIKPCFILIWNGLPEIGRSRSSNIWSEISVSHPSGMDCWTRAYWPFHTLAASTFESFACTVSNAFIRIPVCTSDRSPRLVNVRLRTRYVYSFPTCQLCWKSAETVPAVGRRTVVVFSVSKKMEDYRYTKRNLSFFKILLSRVFVRFVELEGKLKCKYSKNIFIRNRSALGIFYRENFFLLFLILFY